MLKEKDYRAVDTTFQIIGAYIEHATEFQNDANNTYVHSMYSDIVNKVVTQNCSQRCSVAKFEKGTEMFVRSKTRSWAFFSLSAHPF